MKGSLRAGAAGFFRREWLGCLLVAVLFGLNLAALRQMGICHVLNSDDISYISSGVTLAKTGMYTVHDPVVPSAQVMPGIGALIACVSLIFGEGKWLWAALKLLWCAMGALVGWFVYRSVRLYAPAWCAAAATLLLARTDFLWCNNLILTETPFMLCLAALIYCTLALGRTGRTRYAVGLGAAYFLGILVRGNMAVNIIFVAVYLLYKKVDRRRLLKQGVCLLLALLCFFVPWTIRNFIQFKAFIPMTYGVGNPILLGTYQGVGYPADEELDYATHVDEVMPERYAKYYNEDGTTPYRYLKYLELEADGLKASYRQKAWLERDPAGFFVSYLILKPWEMMRGVFYWEEVWEIPHQALKDLQMVLLAVCLVILLTVFVRRKNRPELLLLSAIYLGSLLVYAMGFALDRYNMGLMPALAIFLGIGLDALAGACRRIGRKLRLERP